MNDQPQMQEQPWQWSEARWRGIVNRARAGRSLKPKAWPDGARCAVAISFDADHETIPLRDGDESPMRISQGQYGNRQATPRIRNLLQREAVPATFLPVQRIGVSVEHLAYPGTLTLSAATAIAAWTELGESLVRAGLRKLVLVTSHGGNVAAMELVARNLRARHGMLAVTAGWHRFGYPADTFSEKEKKHGIHGGDVETSLMLAAMPQSVRMDAVADATPVTIAMAGEFKWLGAYRPAGFAWMTQDLNASGAIGDATLASAAKGEAALAHGARAFVELLHEIDRFDLARLGEGPVMVNPADEAG